jgi:uncharacterized membrane protein
MKNRIDSIDAAMLTVMVFAFTILAVIAFGLIFVTNGIALVPFLFFVGLFCVLRFTGAGAFIHRKLLP